MATPEEKERRILDAQKRVRLRAASERVQGQASGGAPTTLLAGMGILREETERAAPYAAQAYQTLSGIDPQQIPEENAGQAIGAVSRIKDFARAAGKLGIDVTKTGARPVVSGLETLQTVMETADRPLRNLLEHAIDEQVPIKPLDAALNRGPGSFDSLRDKVRTQGDKSLVAKGLDYGSTVGAGFLAAGANPIGLLAGGGLAVAKALGAPKLPLQQGAEDMALSVMTSPISSLAGGEVVAPGAQIAKQATRLVKMGGAPAHVAKAAGRAAAQLHKAEAGTADYAPKLKAFLQQFGARADDIDAVLGKGAELAGQSGLRVGLPGFAAKYGVELGPIVNKAVRGATGKILPEQPLNRAFEVIGKAAHGHNLPRHSRMAVENARSALVHDVSAREARLVASGMPQALARKTALSGAQGRYAANIKKAGVPWTKELQELGSRTVTEQPPGTIGRIHNNLMSWFKESALARPGKHVVDVSEDLQKMATAGMDPSPGHYIGQFRKAQQALSGAPGATVGKTGLTAGQIQDLAERAGFNSGHRYTRAKPGKLEAAVRDVASPLRRPLDKFADSWNKHSKTALLIDQLEKGQSPAAAVANVRRVLFDVLTPPASKAGAGAFKAFTAVDPFGGFTARSLGAIPKLMVQNPGRAMMPYHAANAARSVAPDENKGPLERREQAIQAPLSGDALDAAQTYLGVPEKNGAQVALRGSLPESISPLLNAFENWDHPEQIIRGEAERLSPAIQLLLEQRDAKDAFGRELPYELNSGRYWANRLGNTFLSAPTQLAGNQIAKAMGAERAPFGLYPDHFGDKDDKAKLLKDVLRIMTAASVSSTSPLDDVSAALDTPEMKRAEKLQAKVKAAARRGAVIE